MLKIISFKICPFVQRVTGLLEAKGLPYQIEYISLSNKPQWFLDISPNGQVPLLVTEQGEALFESDAIVEYLDEVSEPLELQITPEQRAKDRAWSYMAVKNYLVQCGAMRSPDQASLESKVAKLRAFFAKADQAIAQGPYFKGNQLSNVDVAWLPLLHRAEIIRRHAGFDMLEGFLKVQAWQRALTSSGLATKSVSSDFEQLFTDFYLSDETYLGLGSDCRIVTDRCAQGNCC